MRVMAWRAGLRSRAEVRLAAALLLVAGLPGGLASGPAAAADPEAGRALAQEWCSSCHYVEGGRAASDVAPAFAEIAKRAAATEDGWRTWLSDPHPPMPNLQLSNAEIESVVAFLKSLRAP